MQVHGQGGGVKVGGDEAWMSIDFIGEVSALTIS